MKKSLLRKSRAVLLLVRLPRWRAFVRAPRVRSHETRGGRGYAVLFQSYFKFSVITARKKATALVKYVRFVDRAGLTGKRESSAEFRVNASILRNKMGETMRTTEPTRIIPCELPNSDTEKSPRPGFEFRLESDSIRVPFAANPNGPTGLVRTPIRYFFLSCHA